MKTQLTPRATADRGPRPAVSDAFEPIGHRRSTRQALRASSGAPRAQEGPDRAPVGRGRIAVVPIIALAATLFSISSCEPRHIKPYTPRYRMYDPGKFAEADPTTESTVGSVWRASSPSLFEDMRASRIGDILTVVIDEESKGTGDATTQLNKSSGIESGIVNFLGLLTAVASKYPEMDPSKLISLLSKSDFSGEGSTSRSGKLEGHIAVRVREVMPNGDLFVEGHKVILLNEEELHFYVSGVVRQIDVKPDNSVSSSLIADAQVEFSGRGVVADTQSPGWIQRLVNAYSPI